jgi:hypothetical protein
MSAPTTPEQVETVDPEPVTAGGVPFDADAHDALDVRMHSLARGLMPRKHVLPALRALHAHLRTLPLAEVRELHPEHPRVRAHLEGFASEKARLEKQNTNPSKQK